MKNILLAIMAIMVIGILSTSTPNDICRKKMREYQIEIDNDSFHVFDGERKVGSCSWEDNNIDSIISNDKYNQ